MKRRGTQNDVLSAKPTVVSLRAEPRGSRLNTGGHHGQTSPSSSDSALENSADAKNEMERASRDRTAARA